MTCHVILCLLKKIANPFQKEYLNLKSKFFFFGLNYSVVLIRIKRFES